MGYNFYNENSNLENMLQKTYYSPGSTIYDQVKNLVDQKLLPAGKPFLAKNGYAGNFTMVGHIYSSYNYGGFLVITIGDIYAAYIQNGTFVMKKITGVENYTG